MPMMHPISNLNGTSRDELIAMRLKAHEALRDAMQALQDLNPNMRDYLGNQEIWRADRSIHVERFKALDAMANDIMDEAVSLSEHGA